MAIDPKGVTFSVLLAGLGGVLVVIGAAEKIGFSDNFIEVNDIRFRLVLLGLGVLLFLGAIVFQLAELRPPRLIAPAPGGSGRAVSKGEELNKSAPTAKEFFLTLDHDQVASFPASVAGAIRLQILARTVVNLVGQYGKTFEDLARNGCEVQILVVDPDSEAAHHVYGNSYALYRQNAHTALGHLAVLQEKYGEHLHVRFFSYVPTVSIMNVEKRDAAASYAQVQMYFIHGAKGRDRPIFEVYRTDPWYDVFKDEFNSIWNAFPDVRVADHMSKL